MSFQAYINNIKAKTGKTPADFKELAEKKGFLKDGQIPPTGARLSTFFGA
ncbi:DUF4287 domain-containing protein [Flavobacterium sp. ZB4P13]